MYLNSSCVSLKWSDRFQWDFCIGLKPKGWSYDIAWIKSLVLLFHPLLPHTCPHTYILSDSVKLTYWVSLISELSCFNLWSDKHQSLLRGQTVLLVWQKYDISFPKRLEVVSLAQPYNETVFGYTGVTWKIFMLIAKVALFKLFYRWFFTPKSSTFVLKM